MTGRSGRDSVELPISVSSELQRRLVLGIVAAAAVLSIGMGPGMIVPTSGQSKVQHRLAG